jgi:hypothetical protein
MLFESFIVNRQNKQTQNKPTRHQKWVQESLFLPVNIGKNTQF